MRLQRAHTPLLLSALLTLLGYVTFPVSSYGEQEAMHIEQIEPAIIDDRLAISALFMDLFSPKIVSTIQSGLSAVVHVNVELMERSETKSLFSRRGDRLKTVMKTEWIHSISYNIWNEYYTLHTGEDERRFEQLNEAKEAISQIKNKHFTELKDLRSGVEYTVRMQVQVVPISSTEGERVADWLRDPNRAVVAGEDPEQGFQFNIDELITAFWGRKRQARNTSAWQLSTPFRLDSAGALVTE